MENVAGSVLLSPQSNIWAAPIEVTDFKIEIRFLHNVVESEDSEWFTVIAMLRGIPIGTCDLASWKKEHPFLQSLCVQPCFRRLGVATAIVSACIEKCRESRKKCVVLTVNKENTAAQALYRKLGFKSCTETDKDLWMSIPLNQ